MRASTAVLLLSTGVAGAVFSSTSRASSVTVQRSHEAARAPIPVAVRPPDVHMLAVQVWLDRAGFSPGEIDGYVGENTTLALRAFQHAYRLAVSGSIDDPTLDALRTGSPADAFAEYTLTAEDLSGPWTAEIPTNLMDQAALPALGFTSALEMLGEKFHCSPKLLQALNPVASFSTEGERVRVPNVAASARPADPASVGGPQPGQNVTVSVSKQARAVTVTAADGHIVLHAPVTVGSEHDPLPVGQWAVTAVQPSPVFNYNPDLFWDADPSHAKTRIPAGPNNPVGVVWVGLTREHYGLHGTPEPSRVGKTESHGCVRLTNWDAARVATLVTRGTPVSFTE
jgi:lipoprotein-anchoring transpeptidase ErfK/SrfK